MSVELEYVKCCLNFCQCFVLWYLSATGKAFIFSSIGGGMLLLNVKRHFYQFLQLSYKAKTWKFTDEPKRRWHLKYPPSRPVCGTWWFFIYCDYLLFLVVNILLESSWPRSNTKHVLKDKNSVAYVGLYMLSSHKVLIVLENKLKQIPELTGICRMVTTQEVLNMSPRQGLGADYAGNCLVFDCNCGFKRLEMFGKNNWTYGMH